MKRYIINGYIDAESVEKFVSFVDNNPDEQVTIYLSSGGGTESGMLVMLDVINKEPGRFEVYAIERIFSCAFELFFRATCMRRIAPATIGMCHLTACDMKMMANGVPAYDADKALLKSDKLRNDALRSLLSEIGVQKKDYLEIMKGEDVYFQWGQLMDFMANQHSVRL